jgi:hypothetical protein
MLFSQQQQERTMFSVSVVKDSYLLVVVSGRGTLGTFRAVARFVADLIAIEHDERVLVDLLASEQAMNRDEHRVLVDLVAKLWKGTQVAVVVPSDERALIGQQAAQANGANLRTFTNLHDAGDWLKLGG